MTASATERDAHEETSPPTRHSRLRIDFSAFEAFRAASDATDELPRIVRWMGCFARADCERE